MKIASISLQNFKSYRDFQKISFGMDDKSITIFEGQMGHGKSNLLNAFYWCLFEQYWDSDKSKLMENPNPTEVALFNKGAILEYQQEGETIGLFVEIEFYDDSKNKYTIKRSQNGSYINAQWRFEKNSKISLDKIDSTTGEYKKYTSEEAEGEVLKFFPRSLSNYFLFRGENRAQLVKLQGRDEFQLALQELSKLEMFKRAEAHLSKVLDQLRSELAAQASASIKREMEDILSKKQAAENAKQEYETERAKLIEIEQHKKDAYDFYSNKIKENQAAFEFNVKAEHEEKLIQELQKQIQIAIESKQRDLTKRWVALGVSQLFDQVQSDYKNAVESGHYPPDISQSFIDKILSDLECICGNHFTKNSDVFDKIRSLREIGSIDVKLLHEVEKLKNEMERGQQTLIGFPNKIKEVDLHIQELLSEVKSKQIIINGYKSKIGKIDFTLDELQKKQDETNEEYIKTREKIRELKDLIETKTKDISTLESEFQKLEGKLDRSNLPAIRVDLAEKALAVARDLKRKFENSIYDDLEKYTQENWEMLVYDKLNYDKLILLRDVMYFEVYDRDGFPSRASMNTGHSILLVLSFISALIKIAKEVWEEEFPLVLDAPLSEIGESAIAKALVGFGRVFNQTIVILKDGTVNQLILNQLKDKVSKRYWIELDKARQHTKVTTVNN